MKLIPVLIFLCLCLRVEISSAQCSVATILPSDVVPSIADEYFTSQLTEQIAELNQTVTKIVQAYHVDVYSIAVVYRNSTIFSAGLVDTLFRIGSVTKVFAALGPLLLRKQGVLTLDDPVTKFLPGFSVIDPDGEHNITLRELMGHLSGLPRNLCASLFCDSDLSEEESLELIAKKQLARPLWSFLPLYSNLGFAILGHAWEKATSPRKSWSAFLRDELWTPLGMRHTGVAADLVQETLELAPGNVQPYLANYSLGWQGPCGDMYSTAQDLAKFLKFLLHPSPLLSDEAIREMTHPTTVFPDTSSGWIGFALPWELIRVTPNGTNRSTTLITKNGGLGTYNSFIAFHPDSQLGVAVSTSVLNNTLVAGANEVFETLGVTIMQDLIPAVQSVHSKFISSLYSGVYKCNHTAPVVSAHAKNTTLEVLGGSISVTTMTLDKNLVANFNVSLLDQTDDQSFFAASWSLWRKRGRDRHSFWSSPGSCSAMAQFLGIYSEIARPNFPDSVDLYELQFDPEAKLLRWPAVGGVCYKS